MISSTNVSDSGSNSSPKSTLQAADGDAVEQRQLAGCVRRQAAQGLKKISRPSTNAATTRARRAVTPAVGPAAEQQQHARAGQRERDQQPGEPGRTGGGPTSGSSAARSVRDTASSLVLQQVRVVDARGAARPEDRHDDREADHDLGRGDDHDEERHDLAVERAVDAGRT